MKGFTATVMISLFAVSGCSNSANETSTLNKSNRENGDWERIGTFYGFANNYAACDEIAKILNNHPDEFSGQIKSKWSCE
jgi:hypothetical protein